MKIMVISDIHGSYHYIRLAIEAFNQHKADTMLILGDILYHGPRNPFPEKYSPIEVLEALNQFKDKIIAVRGNCDSEVDQMVLQFNIMQDSTLIHTEKQNIFATHGHIYSPDHLPPLNQGDIFISGHIHLPIAKQENGIFILNPGSISLPKEDNPNSYGMITEEDFTIYNFDHQILKQIQF